MASRTLPPQYWLTLISLAGVLVALSAMFVALQINVPLPRVVESGGQLALDGKTIGSFDDGQGSSIAADPNLLMEEPDMLPDWPTFNAFMANQGRLAEALVAQRLTATLADGSEVALLPRHRGPWDLPGAFWMQLAFGLAGLLMGAGIWAFNPRDTATRLYAITGAGLAGAAMSAAVYSTRELAIDASLFRTLSAFNHFSTFIFAAALLGLLWHYPKRLGRFPVTAVAFAIAIAFWIAEILQVADKTWVGLQTGVLVLFSPCFLVATMQWRRHRAQAIERAALTWFLLSVFSGTILFAALILAPPLFGAAPIAEQSLMFGVFLFVYIGIAAALTRYRLFDIERWWFNAWLWFLAGLLIVLLDAFLLMLLPIAGDTAALFAVAIIGWLYFPVRLWLWRRAVPDQRDRTSKLLRSFVGELAGIERVEAMPALWRRLLGEAFDPLTIEPLQAPPAAPAIVEDGLALDLPETSYLPALKLRHARRGMRLFAREDRELATALVSLAGHSAQTIANRQRGIDDERQRIMRDLHDDLGSKLLTMSHTGDATMQQLARSAFQDLRDVLRALDAGPTRLGELMDRCRFELQGRAETHDFVLTLDAHTVERDTVVTAREATNIARLLREAASNAIRHAEAREIQVTWSQAHGALGILIRHDGQVSDPAAWIAGRGVRSQRARAADLGGTVEWTIDEADGRLQTQLTLRLQAAA